jgi:hypothetical protein
VTAHESHPHLRIVRGDPTPEEVAALVAVLAAAVAPAGAEAPAAVAPPSRWAPPERMLRQPLSLTGWWDSSLPR